MRAWKLLLVLVGGCGPCGEPAAEAPIRLDCRPVGAASATVAPFPPGTTLPSGWTVTDVEAGHPEFVRVGFEKGGEETRIEVKYRDGEPSDWATRHYQLMPAPGEAPPEALLKDAMGALEAAEGAGGAPIAAEVKDPYAGLPPCG